MTHTVRIGSHYVGPDKPIAFIAEVGINHNGDIPTLNDMVDQSKRLAIPFVKIQTRMNHKGELTDVYTNDELMKPRAGVPRAVLENARARSVIPDEDWKRIVESNFENVLTWDQKRALELTLEETRDFIEHCRSNGMVGFSSPWCLGAVDFLEEAGVDCYKVASAIATDDAMLEKMARTGKPVLLSTGMMDMPMVEHAVQTLLNHMDSDKLIIMHCTSIYSTPAATPGDAGRSSLNLRCIETYRQKFDPIVIGFSGNDPGVEPMKQAAALGACIIEKHVTPLRTMYGSDQASSVEFRELEAPLRVLAEMPDVLGNGVKCFYDKEKEVAAKLRRS